MAKAKYDVVVIGSGPGGYVTAIRAAQLGFKTACVEKDKTLGGTCLNVGCIPSKALLQSTEYFSIIEKEGATHGIDFKGLKPNLKQMMERKESVVKGLTDGIDHLFKKNKIDRLQGVATFLDPHTIEISDGKNKEKVESEYFILATGSEPIPLPFMPFDEERIVSSTGALSLKSIPKKMLVIGAGVIGVELASVYRRLGAEVTIVEMLDHICPGMDQTISKTFLQILKKQGLEFYLSAKVTAGEVGDKGVSVTFTHGDQEIKKDVDVVLVAVGRRPYTKGLGLDKAKVAQNKQGQVIVDSHFRTSQANIFAIGDLIDGPMLAHKASEEGVAAVEIIAGQTPHVNYIAIPNVVYTHPEVAAAGLTEEEAKELGRDVVTGTFNFRGNPRARCANDTDGIVKVVGDKETGRLLGIHIVGPHASELIGEAVIALEKRATLEEVARASHAHPTLCEAIKDATLAALKRPIHG